MGCVNSTCKVLIEDINDELQHATHNGINVTNVTSGNKTPHSYHNERIPEETTRIGDCEEFIFSVPIGRVGKVYDVDTITIMFYEPVNNGDNGNYKLYKKSCRIYGIDGPELKSKNKYERKIAIKGQQFLENLILGKVVTLHNNKKDKYGRMLADVYFENIKISDILLENKYVIAYDGKKKRSPKNWEKFHKHGKMI